MGDTVDQLQGPGHGWDSGYQEQAAVLLWSLCHTQDLILLTPLTPAPLLQALACACSSWSLLPSCYLMAALWSRRPGVAMLVNASEKPAWPSGSINFPRSKPPL